MQPVNFLVQVFLLLAFELIYIRLAIRYTIIDKPNQRSSHSTPTVRGGGVIFIFAIILWFLMNFPTYPYFVTGALLIAIISFADDLGERPALLRLGIQGIAFLLLLLQVNLLNVYDWLFWTTLIVSLGTINAFNFMDGINGITGVYSLVSLLTFLFINTQIVFFTDEELIIVMGLAMLVFLFFNFRKHARCFGGDVGSVTIGFFLIFLMLQLIDKSGDYNWVLMFLVYGVDSVVTILYRIKRRENIFKAHRSHLYQLLANELKFDHRLVALFYGALQLAFNVVLIYSVTSGFSLVPITIAVLILIMYGIARQIVVRKISFETSSESH